MDETSDLIRFEFDGPVAVITMNRPEVLNALHPQGHRAMSAALERFRDDPALYAAILTGAGERAFCVGTDLKALADTLLQCAPLALHASKQVRQQSQAVPDLFEAMRADSALAELMLRSQDAAEGPRAFAEKRRAQWTGR